MSWIYINTNRKLTTLPIICDIMSNDCQECITVAWCPSIEKETYFSFQSLRGMDKKRTCQNQWGAYQKHSFGFLDYLLTQFHHSPVNTIFFQKCKIWGCSPIAHGGNELWVFNLSEGLIACHHPLDQKLFKFILVPRLLREENGQEWSTQHNNRDCILQIWLSAFQTLP